MVHPLREEIRIAAGAIWQLLHHPVGATETVESFLGLLRRLQLTVRSTLAIWQNVDLFIRELRDMGVTRSSERGLEEFQTYLYLIPLMSFSMDTPWFADVSKQALRPGGIISQCQQLNFKSSNNCRCFFTIS